MVNCRFNKVFVRVLVGLALCTLVGPSLAAGAKDKEAKELQNQAIMTDYLAMQFGPAVEKLQKALELCAPDKCSAKVVAEIHRDLAVVYIASEKPDEGKAEFVAAFTADPNVQLDKDLATEAVQAAFNEVKASMGGKKGKKGEKGAKGEKAEQGEQAAPSEAASSGDIIHQPPAEGMIMTPLPIYAELVPGVNATKLQVRYKTATGDWESADMKKVGTGYGVEIPCKGVGSSPRELQYIIQAYDKQDVVAFSGSRTAPHKVAIKTKFEGTPPTLPDGQPPTQCVEECPPGFPGCGRGEGADCATNDDCKEGLVCKNETCTVEKIDETAGPGKKAWISLAVQQDLMIFPAGTGICSGGNSYRCFFAAGKEYLGQPDHGPNQGNAISSTGFAIATTRFLAGFDYLVKPWLSLGARVGWAINGVPTDFKPFHLEARGAWWIIKRTAKPGVRPYVLLSGGVAEVDGRLSVNVQQSETQLGPPKCTDPSGKCQSFKARPVDAWRAGGLVFISPGVGAMYQIKQRWGVYLELKMAAMFPTSSLTGAAQLGGSFGF